MALDPSIALRINPPRIESPLNALSQVAQLRAAQRQDELGGLELAQKREDIGREQAFRNALSMGGDVNDPESAARLRQVDPMRFNTLLTQDLERRTKQATLGKTETEVAGLKATQGREARIDHVQALAGVADPESTRQWIMSGVQKGFAPMQLATAEAQKVPDDPAAFAQWFPAWQRQQMLLGLKPADQLKAKTPEYDWKDTGGALTPVQKNALAGPVGPTAGIAPLPMSVSPNALLSNQTTIRGQNMADARARETVAATMSKPFEVTGPEGLPMLVQQGRSGGLTPVQGFSPKGGAIGKPLAGPVLKQLTEARDNATTIDRLTQSFKPEYAGKGVFGLGADMQIGASGNLGVDKDAVEWWKNYRKQAELIERHALFGAALTPTEQGSWRSADIGPGMDADVVAKNLATRSTLAKKVLENTRQDLIDAGHAEGRINAITARSGTVGDKDRPAVNTPGAAVKVKSMSEAMALKPGTTFIDPNGVQRVR